jgi:hypothetical protein
MAITLSKTRPTSGVSTYAGRDLTWRDANKAGIRLAAVRASREEGQFLGYVGFDAMVSTGLHQHTGPASSYFLSGGLADYQGEARAGDLGVNLAGATHDAIAYRPTLMASRLDAPVLYPGISATQGEPLHTGARAGEIINSAPDILPDINIPVERLSWEGTTFAGLSRKLLFDYATTGLARRCVQVRLLPGTRIGPVVSQSTSDVFVLGGDLAIESEVVCGGDFAVIEPGARFMVSSRYGCLAFIWLDGPWIDQASGDAFAIRF